MRFVPFVSTECIQQLNLNQDQVQQAQSILSQMGVVSMDRVAHLALSLDPVALDAALLTALHHPYPWHWYAMDLTAVLNVLSEEYQGSKMMCALILQHKSDNAINVISSTSKALVESLPQKISCLVSASMTTIDELSSKSHHARLDITKSFFEKNPPLFINSLSQSHLRLQAIPILYTPEQHGPYDAMTTNQRLLLAETFSEAIQNILSTDRSTPSRLLGFGPLSYIVDEAESISGPVRLQFLFEKWKSFLRCSSEFIAVTVSMHESSNQQYIRVALREAEQGIFLEGMQWPCTTHGFEYEFTRLIELLAHLGVVYCYQVEGVFEELICSECSDLIYPTPEQSTWLDFALKNNINPDGSHSH